MKDTADNKTSDMFKTEPKSNAERQKAYRAKQKNRLDMYISDDASEQLNTLAEQGNTTKKEVLEGLICKADVQQMKDDFFTKQAQAESFKAQVQKTGEVSLGQLYQIAQGDTDQSLIVRAFLLGCYNGENRFDLTDFRRLDLVVFQQCLSVLNMDWGCKREIHEYLPNGSKVFQSWVNK